MHFDHTYLKHETFRNWAIDAIRYRSANEAILRHEIHVLVIVAYRYGLTQQQQI